MFCAKDTYLLEINPKLRTETIIHESSTLAGMRYNTIVFPIDLSHSMEVDVERKTSALD